MSKEIQDGWIRWLDERESIELIYLMVRRRLASSYKYRQRIHLLRMRALQRRLRRNADFLVYQQAME